MTRDHLADGEAMIDWTGGPVLTDPRHQIVLKAIAESLKIGNPDLQIMNDGPDRDQTVFEAPWRDIQDAVGNYEAALWLANLPCEDRIDWRRGLGLLKRQPDLLEAYLEHESYRIVLASGLGLDGDTLDEDMEDEIEIPRENLAEAIDSILANKILKAKGGRETDWPFVQFIASILEVYESISGRRAGLSRFELSKIKKGHPGGPAFRFLLACVALVRNDVTDEGLADRIKQFKHSRRPNK